MAGPCDKLSHPSRMAHALVVGTEHIPRLFRSRGWGAKVGRGPRRALTLPTKGTENQMFLFCSP